MAKYNHFALKRNFLYRPPDGLHGSEQMWRGWFKKTDANSSYDNFGHEQPFPDHFGSTWQNNTRKLNRTGRFDCSLNCLSIQHPFNFPISSSKRIHPEKKKSILESLFQVAPTLRKSPSHHGPIHQDRRIGPKGGFDLLHPSQPRLELRRHGAAAAGITPGEHPTARDPNGEGGFLVWDPGWG